MTIQQIEQRLSELERQFAEMQSQVKAVQSPSTVEDTFGMFADDPAFDEIVELGREYRKKANAGDCVTEENEC